VFTPSKELKIFLTKFSKADNIISMGINSYTYSSFCGNVNAKISPLAAIKETEYGY